MNCSSGLRQNQAFQSRESARRSWQTPHLPVLLLNGWTEIARDEWVATTGAIASFILEMPGRASVPYSIRRSMEKFSRMYLKKFSWHHRANIAMATRQISPVVGTEDGALVATFLTTLAHFAHP